MIKADWDKRYSAGEHLDDEPHSLITRVVSSLKPGRALDVACGPGRHAIWLAERGWTVTAVDLSRVAIDILQQRARVKGVEIDSLVADLEKYEFTIEPESYDLIVVCNYLQRDLFPAIRKGTRVGGIVIAIIAMVDDDPQVRPMNPAYLLNPGELRAQFARWNVIHDFEGKPAEDSSRATAQIAARRTDTTNL
jgi:SAM-dependent methyltransferase